MHYCHVTRGGRIRFHIWRSTAGGSVALVFEILKQKWSHEMKRASTATITKVAKVRPEPKTVGITDVSTSAMLPQQCHLSDKVSILFEPRHARRFHSHFLSVSNQFSWFYICKLKLFYLLISWRLNSTVFPLQMYVLFLCKNFNMCYKID